MGAIPCGCNSTSTLLDLWNTFFYCFFSFFDHFCWFTIDVQRELKVFFFSIKINYNLLFFVLSFLELFIYLFWERKQEYHYLTECKTLLLRINWLIKFVISFSNTSVFNLSDCLKFCSSNFCYTTRGQIKYITNLV